MLTNLRLKHIRLELLCGAYIRADVFKKRTEFGLYKTFYGPFERGVCLGYLTSRQFKTLLSSGFITCCPIESFVDGHMYYFYVLRGDEE